MFKIKGINIFRDAFFLVALVTVFGYLTTRHNPFLIGVPQHPYLLVVVMMAVRYGTAAGTGSAVALSFLYMLGGLARTGAGAALPPLLEAPHSFTISGMFLFAVVIGSVCDAFRGRIKEMEMKKRDDVKCIMAMERDNRLLIKTNKTLRGRIMEETTTFQTVYEIAKKLSVLQQQRIYPAVLEIISKYVKAESCSFYLLEGESLNLEAHRGWDQLQPVVLTLSVKEAGDIMSRAIKEKTLVTLKDLAHQENRDPGGKVMAVPVCSQGDKQVMGVIAIEKIPFDHFNPQTVRIFSLIAEWTATALANAALFCKAEEGVAARERMLGELLLQMEIEELPGPAFNRLSSLKETIIPVAGDLLLDSSVRPNHKKILLTNLEYFHRQGKQLASETYRTFAFDSLRNWYLFERYRAAAQDEKSVDAGLLLAYLEEQQREHLAIAGRGLALMAANGSGSLVVTGTDILEGKIPLDKELTRLMETVRKRDRYHISRVAEKIWGYKPAPFMVLLHEMLTSHDSWIKATSIHSIAATGNSEVHSEILENINDHNPIVRETAIKALAQLNGGSPDKTTAGMLKDRIESDSDPRVSEMAKYAISLRKEKRRKKRVA